MQGPAERRLGSATRLLFSQVAYLVHDNLDVLRLGTVLVGPCVRVELASEEDFLSLLEEIPRDDLLVVVELLLDVICDATGNILTDMELLKKIRQWRYDKAKEKNMRAYWIFNNATLVDLATRQPMTREELLSISGIGEKKIELYGMKFF